MHRTLIYCQTRKQCSLLFRLFEVYLGEQMYHQDKLPQNRIVNMYHAGTVASAKTHISDQMARHDGTIRVLIYTNAFGMGVNCKEVRNVIHFGPSKTVESYMQECGRAGVGKPSLCNLLYNGLLSVHCDNNMKQYLQLEECSRQWLLSHFGCNVDTSQFTPSCISVVALVCKNANAVTKTVRNFGVQCKTMMIACLSLILVCQVQQGLFRRGLLLEAIKNI